MQPINVLEGYESTKITPLEYRVHREKDFVCIVKITHTYNSHKFHKWLCEQD